MPGVSVAKTFSKSAGSLASNDRARVLDFLTKFLENPANPGLSVERVQDAMSVDIWSARITGSLRAIYHKDGQQLTLLYAGQHDDAYDWAGRRRLEHHPVTGTLQIVETTEEAEQRLSETHSPSEAPSLFDAHEDDYLVSLGLPKTWLPVIRKVKTDDDLLTILGSLPEEVGERLLSLADGELVTPPPPVTPDKPLSANPDNLRRFWVVQDAEDLREMLEKPLDDWVRFLHPTQREIVTGTFNGPVKVTGSAGTGKTVVAMHRAAHLAGQGKQVLVTSFVTTLCENIEHNLDILCSERQRKQITVSTVHAQALKLARMANYWVNPDDDQTIERLIERFQDYSGAVFDRQFLIAEWNGVVASQGVLTWEEYRDAKRIGRGRGLQVRERKLVWKVFQRVFEALEDKKSAVWSMICRRVQEALESGQINSPFDAVIVDEVQDLKPQELRLLSCLAASSPENLLLCGDAGQRIYPGGFSLKRLGIDVRGRSRILRINYRTTEQIRRFADSLIPAEADDLDDAAEDRRGTRSLLRGPVPVLRGFKKPADQVAFVLEQLKRLLDEGLKPEEIAVFARSKNRLDPLIEALRATDIPVHQLSRDSGLRAQPGLNVGTMHRAKGLEFKVVFAFDCSEGIVPHEVVLQKTRDPSDYEAARLREMQLLYVSVTRARDEAYITWAGSPSPFLPKQDT